MQCPLSGISCCLMTPKVIFLALGVLSLGIGVLSAFRPGRSIALYQKIMERFNWRVTPIDEAKEVRNTVRFGFWLIALGLALGVVAILKF